MPNPTRLFIVGSSSHGRSVAEVACQRFARTQLRFYDDTQPAGTVVKAGTIIGGTDVCAAELTADDWVFVAVGHNGSRHDLVQALRSCRPRFATLVDQRALVAPDVELGEGTVVMPGAILRTGASIGAHCIINTGAIVEHDCAIGDFASVGPGAALGGSVRLGRGCFVGLGACLSHGVEIGDDTVVGAGSTVLRSIEAGKLAVGTPARVVRDVPRDHPYV